MCPFPLLYSLFINDCVSHHSVQLVKFADDTTLEGLVTKLDESEFRHEVNRLVSWSDNNNIQLNASKTLEMIVDFRMKSQLLPLLLLIVNLSKGYFTFLGTILYSCEKGSREAVLKFLHQLKKFGLRREILVQFYRSAIESILAFSICVWFGRISQRQRSKLDGMVKTNAKMMKC